MRFADSLGAMALPLKSRSPNFRSLQSRAPAPPGAPAPVPLGGTRAEAARRLQMGLAGVVAVLVLIGLASIIKDRASQTDSTAVAEAAPTTAPSASATVPDPLAEAGVVPDVPAGGSSASGQAAGDARSVTPAASAPSPAAGAR